MSVYSIIPKYASLSAFLFGLLATSYVILSPYPVSAANTNDFNSGNIMSDNVFTNKNSMTVEQIQQFLQSKNSVCLIDLKVLSINDIDGNGLGDEPYGKGINEEVSAAKVIWQAAQLYNINPQVILATLQKEQGLITRTDCPTWRYNTALGYGCPDTAPCDNSAYGFTRQIDYGVWHFQGFFNDTYPVPTKTPGNRDILYNPDNNCGSRVITIQNRATAALYSYTPYQPNAATLAAAVGQTVDCGAYGNLNFWRYFTDWFGSTTNPSMYYALIKSPDSPEVYLQTSAGKYYIPSGALMTEWGIDQLPIQQVSQSYIDSLATGPWLNNLLKDDWNNYFLVEGGKLHYIRDANYLSLWNKTPNDAVQSLGLTYTLKSDTWLGRFVRDPSEPTGQIWLINKGQKHLISNADTLYQWRYTPDQLTTVSKSYLDTIPTSQNNVTLFATSESTRYAIDSGRKLSLNNSNVQHAYYGSNIPVTYDPVTLSFLPTESANHFTVNTATGQWFMLESNKKHYIESAEIAELWGKSSTTPLTRLSNGFLSTIQSAENLTTVVQTSTPTMYWVIDGTKRHIADTPTANAWIIPGSTPPTYSTQSLDLLTRGTDATTTINAVGSPYHYIMDAGKKRYMMSAYSREAWGGTVMHTRALLVSRIPEGSFINYMVKNSSGQAYLLMNKLSYIIDPAYYNEWGVNDRTPVVADSTINRYSPSNVTLRAYIKIGNSSYVMMNGNKIPLNKNYDAYQPTSLGQETLPNDYFSSIAEATYLAKSTDSQDPSVWLISNGKKYLFNNFATYVSYGHLSRGITITPLSPNALSALSTAPEIPGLFIKPAGTQGIKFLNFGTSLGFPNGETLSNLLGSSPVLVVSDSIYNSIPLVGSVSRVIKDDNGKIYFVENGKKRWITSGIAYDPYRNYPVTYLYSTTMSLIPDGPAIN
jgi:hypothetical protein